MQGEEKQGEGKEEKEEGKERSGILAQLGEHLPYKQRVIGSNPIGPMAEAEEEAGVAELADAQDLKSCGGDIVPVRFRSPASVRVAQLDRAPGYGPGCREFESSHARRRGPRKWALFLCVGLKIP